MLRRFLLALLTLGLVLGSVSSVVHAADTTQPKNKGLYISPLRSYVTLNAGESITRAFTVANLTEKPLTLTTSIDEFSVADYTYDFRFTKPNRDWLQLVERSVTLDPYQSHEIPYRVTLPSDAEPGGHYYTLYASSTTEGGATNSTVRAATLLYLTVNGDLQRTSRVTRASLPRIVISPNIEYSLDIENTGNTHYFAYIAARVDGLFYNNVPTGTSQLLMPGTTRASKGSISSPLIPGIYKLSYIVTPDQGKKTEGSQYFVFLPPWSIALLIIVLASTSHFLVSRHRQRNAFPQDKQ